MSEKAGKESQYCFSPPYVCLSKGRGCDTVHSVEGPAPIESGLV